MVPLPFRQSAKQTSRMSSSCPTLCVESDELFRGWCVVDPSSVWGSSVGDLTKLRTFDSLSLFGSPSGPSHLSLNLLNYSRTVFLWTVSSISWVSIVPSPLPKFETKCCFRLLLHGNRNALYARGCCWWSDWTRIFSSHLWRSQQAVTETGHNWFMHPNHTCATASVP